VAGVSRQRTLIAVLFDLPGGSSWADFQPGELATSRRCLPLAARYPLCLDTSVPVGSDLASLVACTPGALPFYLFGDAPSAVADEACGCLGPGLGDDYPEDTTDPLQALVDRMARLAGIWHHVGGAIVYGDGLVARAGCALRKPLVLVTSPTTRPLIWFQTPQGARHACTWTTAMNRLSTSTESP